MKKTTRWASFIVALIAFVFVGGGCSNVLSNATVNGDGVNNEVTKTMAVLTITAQTDEGPLSFPEASSSESRNINGGVLNGSAMSFYLFTKTKKDTSYVSAGTVTYTANTDATSSNELNTGTIKVSLEDAQYDFVLFAVKNEKLPLADTEFGTLKTAASLMGTTSADLRDSKATVSFKMTPDGLSGTSTVKINLSTTGWDSSSYTIVSSIKKLSDGSAVTNGVNKSTATTLPTAQDASDTTYEYESTGAIDAGTYNFEVAFTQKNQTPAKTFIYSEKIDIVPNHDIIAERAIPEIVLSVPEAPENLYVGFLDPVHSDSDSYNVGFSWTDNSNNESYFQLELLTIDLCSGGVDETAFAGKTISEPWGSAAAKDKVTPIAGEYAYDTLGLRTGDKALEKLGTTVSSSEKYVGGSLLKNNTCVVLKLSLGKRYLARIAAVNDAGASEYAYITLGTAPTISYKDLGNETQATVTATYNQFANDAHSINRYRVVYNLEGGTITNADTTTSTANIVEYRTQNTSANAGQGTISDDSTVTAGTYVGGTITANVDIPSSDIWNPTTDTTTYASLKFTDKSWTYWKTDTSTATGLVEYERDTAISTTNYNPINYTGYKNLNLYAWYTKDTADVTIIDPANYNLTADMITIDTTNTAVTYANSCVTVNVAQDVSTLTATVTPSDKQKEMGIVYDSVTVKILDPVNGNVEKGSYSFTRDASGVWTREFEVSSLKEGVYTLKFSASALITGSDKYNANKECSIALKIVEE